MTEVIKRILKSLSNDPPAGIPETETNRFKALSRYILSINQQTRIEEVIAETHTCFITLLGIRVSAIVIKDTGPATLYTSPEIKPEHALSFTGIPRKDWDHCSVIQLNNHAKEEKRHTSGNHFILTCHSVSLPAHAITLFLHHETVGSDSVTEISDMILQAFDTAVKGLCKLHSLESDASTDPLTGCFNRRWFDNLLRIHVENAIRYDKAFSVILFDIDHFKAVNDTYGHITGDAVLKSVSKITKSSVRNGDFVFRYGGEEFVILLPETNLKGAHDVAGRIQSELKRMTVKTLNDVPLTITASFGLSEYSSENRTGDIIADADAMMYQAKSTGRNRICPSLSSLSLPAQKNT